MTAPASPSIQIYEGDFGMGNAVKPSARLRRMSKRKVKKWLAKRLRAVWDSAKVKL